MTSQGRVGPGKMTPENQDIDSADRSSIGVASVPEWRALDEGENAGDGESAGEVEGDDEVGGVVVLDTEGRREERPRRSSSARVTAARFGHLRTVAKRRSASTWMDFLRSL